jgi:hypothetical protein
MRMLSMSMPRERVPAVATVEKRRAVSAVRVLVMVSFQILFG